ncbi:hypothetical protein CAUPRSCDRAFT_773, partial [Caulochytrium protostelioides]
AKRKIHALTEEVGHALRLDPEMEKTLLAMADNVIEQLTTSAAVLAAHRGSRVLDVRDIQLPLQRNWNFRVP